METLREVFERYGFEPLETPAVENLDTLLGKYGDEGDSLIFKILKRGEGAEKGEADLGLRYDLTVPLARVVAQHGNDLPMPFKRYQMQPVWRADRPAKGRFREFYQCDIDVVGATSILSDAEVLALTQDGLDALGFRGEHTIHLNHRAVLHAVVETAEVPPALAGDVLVVLDKLDKVGAEAVKAEWAERGVPTAVVDRGLAPLLGLGGSNAEVLAGLNELLARHEGGRAALGDLAELLDRAADLGADPGRIRVTPSLARGLGYYTGPIFETVIEGAGGSVMGGGRYDGLVKRLGGPDLPAVGTSFGLERLLTLLEEREAGGRGRAAADVYVALPWAETVRPTLRVARALREAGLRTLVAPAAGGKLLKHFQQAERRGVDWVVFVGAEEAAAGRAAARNVKERDQVVDDVAAIVARVRGA